MKRRQVLKAAALGAAIGVSAGLLGPSRPAWAEETITAENWGKMVGFAPDLSVLKVPSGSVIHKGTLDQVKGLLAPGLEKLVRDYALKLKISDYQHVHPSLAYIKATNQHRGKTKVWDVGKEFRKPGWSGYVSGLPFPQPKSGLEVAFNFINTYGGDDAERLYDVTWISASRGVETTEYWRWLQMRTANRTDIDPRPSIGQFAEERTRSASITLALEPYDKKGFGALYFSSLDPVDLTGHVYVPTMRRVLRMSFGTRGDSWNATDFLYEDVGGYLGAAEWMNWKILDKKTMLLPVNSGVPLTKNVKEAFDVDSWPHWNPKANWQARPVYVVEATPKIPDYPYTRMLLLVDAETFTVPYKEAYDKKGQLWKIILGGSNPSKDPNKQPMGPGFAVAIDLQAKHATLVTFRKFVPNAGIDPRMFTVSSLKKRSH